jgi:hypothetical protein
MPVSERERQRMRRLGDIEAASHEEARDRHLALPLEERLRRSWMLFLSLRPAANRADAATIPRRSTAARGRLDSTKADPAS